MEWLSEQEIYPAAVGGASSGSLVAATVARGQTEIFRAAAEELSGEPVFVGRRLLRGRWPYRMTEIVGGVSRRYLGEARMNEARIPLAIVVTQLGLGGFRQRTITSNEQIPMVRAVMASSFAPGPYWRMFSIDGRPTFDGAILARVPILETRQLGPEKVVACVTNPEGRLYRGVIRLKDVPTPPVDFRVLAPIEPLPLGTFDFDTEGVARCLEIGRQSAARFVDREGGWLLS